MFNTNTNITSGILFSCTHYCFLFTFVISAVGQTGLCQKRAGLFQKSKCWLDLKSIVFYKSKKMLSELDYTGAGQPFTWINQSKGTEVNIWGGIIRDCFPERPTAVLQTKWKKLQVATAARDYELIIFQRAPAAGLHSSSLIWDGIL